jgi:hypothetical protein
MLSVWLALLYASVHDHYWFYKANNLHLSEIGGIRSTKRSIVFASPSDSMPKLEIVLADQIF